MTTATSNGDKFTDMDPQRIYIGEDIAFFSATIMRSLTQYKYSADQKEGTSLVPDAATDIGTPSADAKTWTFTLRDGMKWQDGSPLKCEDFKYGASRTFAIDVIVNGPTYVIPYLDIPKNADGSSQYPGPYKATPEQQALFDKAVVCDGNKITYHLSQPIADFNYTATLGMGAVPNPTDHPGVDTGEEYTIKPWSDGPYMIDSYTPGTGGSLDLVRNPNWDTSQDAGYRGAYPDKWVVQIGLDPQVADGRLMQPTGDDQYALGYGNVQTQNFGTVFTDAHTAAPDFAGRAFSDYDPYVRYWWINVNKVKNEKIRQAMAVALDRDSIRAAAGGDFYGDLGDGLIKPNIGADYAETGWATDLFGQAVPASGDTELAKKLIADFGIFLTAGDRPVTGREAPATGRQPPILKEHGMETIAVCVNPAKLLASLRYAFTNRYTVVTELMQNARRAKASYVAVDYDGKAQTLTVRDDGVGHCRLAETLHRRRVRMGCGDRA